MFVFFLGNFYDPHPISGTSSRMQYFIFHSKNGIAVMALGLTYLLVAFFVFFLLVTTEFFRKADKS